MGFRFFNLNPISKSSLCRFFPNANRNFSHLKSSSFIVSSMTTQLLQIQLPNYRNEDNPNWRIFKRRHIGHSHDHHGPPRRSSKEGEKIFWLGLGSDIGLSAGKALTGYFSGSTAIIADAAHSLSDVVFWEMRNAIKAK